MIHHPTDRLPACLEHDMNVSVVIPAYNAAESIADTLSSLCAQMFVIWEVIVVDDGSIDATAAVVDSFVERDSRFRLIRQPQSGVSTARNAGVDHARHDWLLFLDAEDWTGPAADRSNRVRPITRSCRKVTVNPRGAR
jgi:glycosyltransferase involved in cell wall biosynthesis